MTQTVEQFLIEQLEKVAPGKYGIVDVLQLFKAKLRFPCNHLKGGRVPRGSHKDYNLSIFTFPTGVTEIKCLYNCGLKIRSDEESMQRAFEELYDLPTSNIRASSEVEHQSKGGKRIPIDPGPTPTYTDEYRRRIKESNDLFWKFVEKGLADGNFKKVPHPQPIEAPDTQIERGIQQAYQRAKNSKPVVVGNVTFSEAVPALEPVKSTKIRKARKTQSRTHGKKGRTQ